MLRKKRKAPLSEEIEKIGTAIDDIISNSASITDCES